MKPYVTCTARQKGILTEKEKKKKIERDERKKTVVLFRISSFC